MKSIFLLLQDCYEGIRVVSFQQVEREISFRTESGLYFSYYKTLVLSPSIKEGVRRLMYDNVTEYQRTINILERFNVYQEVVLGVLYKSMPLMWQVGVLMRCYRRSHP